MYIMLNKRYHYNKSVALCEDDLNILRELQKHKDFKKKSLAGTLSFVINNFKFEKYGVERPVKT